MSLTNEPEMTEKNSAAPQTNGEPSHDPATPEAPANPAVARFRKGFSTDSQYGLLLALGEEPKEYQRLMESLLEDLQPGEGLEARLVEEMGESLWQMRRTRRMRAGLALKNIEVKLQREQMVAMTQASRAFDILEPFEVLQKALSRRGEGPTAEEIDAFAESRKGDSSAEMQEFILLLKSLNGPMKKRGRKAARRQALAELRRMMEGYEAVAWKCARQSEKVGSPENLAALMAPEDQHAVHLQNMEDLNIRRLWRLTNTLAKVRQGAFQKRKIKKDDDQSRYVYENKQNSDKMPDERLDICVETTSVLQKKAAL